MFSNCFLAAELIKDFVNYEIQNKILPFDDTNENIS